MWHIRGDNLFLFSKLKKTINVLKHEFYVIGMLYNHLSCILFNYFFILKYMSGYK
jgi:hypothetical protein